MQRVLSFQMARGFGESSEFVTKRMCCSFLFSIGFFGLVFGFLLGRFAAERSMELRLEKRRLEFLASGLENTEHLQRLLLDKLGPASFNDEYITNWKTLIGNEDDISKISNMFANFSFFHQIINGSISFLAIARGSCEPDRYVVLSASGDGIYIAIELAKVMNYIKTEHKWEPRRSIIFCIFFGTLDICPTMLSNFIRHKVVGYVALHEKNLQGSGHIVSSGSIIVQSVVLEGITLIQDLYSYEDNLFDTQKWSHYQNALPRLALDMPHTVFSFVEEKNSLFNASENKNFTLYYTALARITSETIWKLSESLILRWNPKYLHNTIFGAVKAIDMSTDIKDRVNQTMENLILNANIVNEKIDTMKNLILDANIVNEKIGTMENTKLLNIRMLNDLTLELDKALLCPDENLRSKTDLSLLHVLSGQSFDTFSIHLNELLKCYEIATQILQEW